jgi:hypothetical protein
MIHVNVRRLVSQVFEVPCQLPSMCPEKGAFVLHTKNVRFCYSSIQASQVPSERRNQCSYCRSQINVEKPARWDELLYDYLSLKCLFSDTELSKLRHAM